MNLRSVASSLQLESAVLVHANKDLVRFVACGSVDHGKSTLIGCLLYGTNGIFDDQLDVLRHESRKYGTAVQELDYSLLLDGLAAEREQKITIDVAYRFFSTANRKFIVADTPGHEQYTRNMATGASTADLALLLVDAASGIRRQTRRHALIVTAMGVRKIALAINKMDKVGWSEKAFRTIEADFRRYAAELDIDEIVCIPTAARSGDNVIDRSANMGWYRGPTVLEYLDAVELKRGTGAQPFRFPVQLVSRPNPDFRGYGGTVVGGSVHRGMQVKVFPSNQESRVVQIVTYDGNLSAAIPGQSVTLVLEDDVDISRGDVIASIEHPPILTDKISTCLVWMDNEPLVPGRSYLLKLGTSLTSARARTEIDVLDLDTRRFAKAAQIAMNGMGRVTFDLDRQIAVDLYADNKTTGGFILIDRDSFDTCGVGFVEREHRIGIMTQLRNYWVSLAGFVGNSGDSRARSVAKAISWRATGSLDTFIIILLFTGSGTWASSIAATEIFTKVVAYYLHERAWGIVRWGRN